MDAVRYWLLREVPPTGDADYSDDAFARAYTAELANDLGNLVSRRGGDAPSIPRGRDPGSRGSADSELRAGGGAACSGDLGRALGEAYDPRAGLDAVFDLVVRANRHVRG